MFHLYTEFRGDHPAHDPFHIHIPFWAHPQTTKADVAGVALPTNTGDSQAWAHNSFAPLPVYIGECGGARLAHCRAATNIENWQWIAGEAATTGAHTQYKDIWRWRSPRAACATTQNNGPTPLFGWMRIDLGAPPMRLSNPRCGHPIVNPPFDASWCPQILLELRVGHRLPKPKNFSRSRKTPNLPPKLWNPTPIQKFTQHTFQPGLSAPPTLTRSSAQFLVTGTITPPCATPSRMANFPACFSARGVPEPPQLRHQ